VAVQEKLARAKKIIDRAAINPHARGQWFFHGDRDSHQRQ
jgi:hypothetical protein